MINKDKLLSNLNPPQAEAVVTTQGPLLVLAGAGSGKTKTLVHRLAYLIAHEKVEPRQILAVTFTNKAAQEMKSRVGALLGKPIDKNGPLVGTFHAVSCRFLRQEAKYLNYPPHFTIYDEGDQKSLVKEALREIGLSTKQIQPGAILNAISRAKSDLMSPQDYARDVADDFFTENVARIYERYQALLVKNKAFDFDDLIGQMVRIWQENPSVLKKYQTNFKYLLVDEYQDVNQAQYIWTSLLAETHHNLCVVGDDWQSIYGWRGANSANILRFKEDYPEAQVIKLEQNYRSTKIIVAAGNTIMKGATIKADKTLWTNNSEGEPIKIIQTEDETAEARFVVEEIIKLTQIRNPKSEIRKVEFLPAVETLVEYEDKILAREFLPDYMKIKKWSASQSSDRSVLKNFAVLYRTNVQSRALEEACLRAGLPYQLVGGIKFYERREVKDMLAWLRLIQNPSDSVSFERAILSVARGVGLTTVEAVLNRAKINNISLLQAATDESLNLATARQKGLLSFVDLFTKWKKLLPELTVAELIDEVAKNSGLTGELDDGTSVGERRLENISELKSVSEARAQGKGKEALTKFLTDISLWQDLDNSDDKTNGVTLMTVHAAKGLEFQTVFVVGMEEGLFPHNSALSDPKELEEERRLVYVAITRARHNVYCSYACQRTIFGKTSPVVPSRFLNELPEEMFVNVLADSGEDDF